MARPRVTTFDIARESNVSRSTVCNILNPKRAGMYSHKVRTRVLQKAEELGYQTSRLASAVRDSLRHLAFAASGVASLDSAFMSQILHGAQREASRLGYLMMISGPAKMGDSGLSSDVTVNTDTLNLSAEEHTNRLASLVSARILDGLLIDKSRFGNAQMEFLESQGIPCVLINGQVPTRYFEDESLGWQFPIFAKMYWVSIDHTEGGRLATEYVLGYGHRRIGLLTPATTQYPQGYRPNMLVDRAEGYKAALKSAGIPVQEEFIVEGSLSDKTTVLRALDRLLRLELPPTALFVADDEMAILAMNYLRETGYRVPGDISIIGYGNLPVCYSVVPNLTTVNVPWAKMGELGVRTLVSLLTEEDKGSIPRVNVLNVKLMEGASVAAPARKE